jgi:hypothetical protein
MIGQLFEKMRALQSHKFMNESRLRRQSQLAWFAQKRGHQALLLLSIKDRRNY